MQAFAAIASGSLVGLSLGLIDDDRAICPLIYHLADDNRDVRDAAAFSLSGMGERIIPPVVAHFAGSNQQWLDASDNLKTAEELGNFDPSVIARNTLDRNQMELLRDGILMLIAYAEKAWVKKFLIATFSNEKVRDADLALIKKCGAIVFDPLVDLLERESDDIRLRAIISLGIIKDKKAVKPLEQQLIDDSSAIREAAAAALRNITETGLLDMNNENDPEKNRVAVTFPCEHCGVPIECGSYYCPSCGAIFFDARDRA
jgi:HEAT repeat protein